MIAADVAVAVLATHRLTRLITTDTITAPLRDRIDRAAMDGRPGAAALAELTGCVWCASVWAAAAVAVLSRCGPGRLTVEALAASSAAALLERADSLIPD